MAEAVDMSYGFFQWRMLFGQIGVLRQGVTEEYKSARISNRWLQVIEAGYTIMIRKTK